jgi:hypothetical protein
LPALNLTTFDAGIFIFAPVRGLRPSRLDLELMLKVPKPTSLIFLEIFSEVQKFDPGGKKWGTRRMPGSRDPLSSAETGDGPPLARRLLFFTSDFGHNGGVY